MASESVQEVNVCISTADTSGLLKKEETTLREWIVKNQIGALRQLFSVADDWYKG